jgi:hypothetical protein
MWIGAYRVLVGRSERKRQLGINCRRWKDNIKMYLREVTCGLGLNSCGSGNGRVVGCCDSINEPTVCIKLGEIIDWMRKC